MSPRVIRLPLSGGDRKHYVRELKWAQAAYPRLLDQAIDAYYVAHRLACQEWNVRQFIGGLPSPSPTIGAAIDGGYTILKVECRACGHSCDVDLNTVIKLVKHEIHTLAKALRCANCNAHKPNLVGLYDPRPGPETKKASASVKWR
jgi:hypothetical protein